MSKKIMIVEDNVLNMKLFCDLASLSGYETIPIKTGREVLEKLQTLTPDLILMDIQLPDISGLEVIKEIKAHHIWQEIPIIAITAFAMKSDEERILEAGAEVYMSKPISIKAFTEQLQEILG